MSLTVDIWNGMVVDWIFSKSKWQTAPNRRNGGLLQIETTDCSFYLLCFLNPYPSSSHLYPTYWRWGKACPKKYPQFRDKQFTLVRLCQMISPQNARPDQFNVSFLPVNTPEPDNANVILPEQALYLFGIHDTWTNKIKQAIRMERGVEDVYKEQVYKDDTKRR